MTDSEGRTLEVGRGLWWSRAPALALVFLLSAFGAGAAAQDAAPLAPAVEVPASGGDTDVTAGLHPAQQHSPTASAHTTPEGGNAGAPSTGIMQLLASLPLPVGLTLVVSLTGLTAAAAGAFAALWITPRTLRRIAELQAKVGREGVAAASQSAAAAADNARAAARNAEVAAQNAQNTGIHAVARLRQEWINTLRDELSELHSTLMNWRPLLPGATQGEESAHRATVMSTNARLAKVQLLLNPTEVASQNLLSVLVRLNTANLTTHQRLRACRWLIRWSQIVLKTEWDRVRDELHGEPTKAPKRRAGRR